MNDLTKASLLLSMTTPVGVICGLEIYNGVYEIGFPLLVGITIMEYFGFRKLVSATGDEVEEELEEEFNERQIPKK